MLYMLYAICYKLRQYLLPLGISYTIQINCFVLQRIYLFLLEYFLAFNHLVARLPNDPWNTCLGIRGDDTITDSTIWLIWRHIYAMMNQEKWSPCLCKIVSVYFTWFTDNFLCNSREKGLNISKLDCLSIMDFSGSDAFACVVGDLNTGRSTVLLDCLIKVW